MTAASNYLENEILDHILGEGARDFTSPATLFVGLFSGSAATALESGDATTGSSSNWGYYEINNGGYERKAIDFAAASSGSAASSTTVTFPQATADYDTAGSQGNTVTHIAIIDNGTAGAGNVLFYGALSTTKTVTNGDTFQINSGSLTISLA